MEVLGRQVSPLIPPVVFGVTALVAGALALLLPETRGQALPYTIEQVRARGGRVITHTDHYLSGGETETESAKLVAKRSSQAVSERLFMFQFYYSLIKTIKIVATKQDKWFLTEFAVSLKPFVT